MNSNDDQMQPPEPTSPSRQGPGAVRRAAWALQENVVWRSGDAARAAADRAKWPLESAGWRLRSRVAWPLEDSFRRRGPIGRTAMAGAAVVLLAGVGAAGAYVANNGRATGPAPAQIAQGTPAPVAPVIAPETVKPVAEKSVLEGATPTFAPKADAAKSGAAAQRGAAADSPGTASPGTASAAPRRNDPAKTKAVGAAPLKVAHRFADAFVSYEVGKSDPKVRRVFSKTATQPLAKSLARRPPRQPAAVKVPRARVLNVVPGPRRGASVSVSVSLLRVGATSELRLQLQQIRKKWLVSDVRG